MSLKLPVIVLALELLIFLLVI